MKSICGTQLESLISKAVFSLPFATPAPDLSEKMHLENTNLILSNWCFLAVEITVYTVI